MLGLDSSKGQTKFVCFHHLSRSDPNVREASTKLVGGLYWMTLGDAQRLCKIYPSSYIVVVVSLHLVDAVHGGRGIWSWRWVREGTNG